MHVLIAVKYQKPVNTLTSLEMSKVKLSRPSCSKALSNRYNVDRHPADMCQQNVLRYLSTLRTNGARCLVIWFMIGTDISGKYQFARLFGVHGFLSLSEVYVILA